MMKRVLMLSNVLLRHAGPNDVNREAELEPPSRIACDLLGGENIVNHFS
jgi:hypothetical protein